MDLSARTLEQRRRDVPHRLEHDIDAWVATTDGPSGTPWLVPLSFLWDGNTLVIATPATSATSRNFLATGKVRMGIGPTRDLVIVEGTTEALEMTDRPDALGDAFATKTGFDPRQLSETYLYSWVRARRLQAWRDANELVGREPMRDGEWIVPDRA